MHLDVQFVPASLVKTTILSPLNYPGIFVIIYLSIYHLSTYDQLMLNKGAKII